MNILRALGIIALVGCQNSAGNSASSEPQASPATAATAKPNTKQVTTPTGLKYEILRKGLSEKPVRGQRVSVHYTGRFEDGRVFDSSVLKKRPPFVVPVGMGKVIKGWDEALLDMGLGEKRKLTIPPHLAYGAAGYPGVIPPNATLIFEVELVGLLEAPAGTAIPAKAPNPTTEPSQEPNR